jgi:hypothetical protein
VKSVGAIVLAIIPVELVVLIVGHAPWFAWLLAAPFLVLAAVVGWGAWTDA